MSKYILAFTFFLLGLHASAAKSVVVLLGGFGSCSWASEPSELNMWDPLQKALIESDQNIPLGVKREISIFRTCYALSPFDLSVDKGLHSRHISSNKERLSIHSVQKFEERRRLSEKAFFGEVVELVNSDQGAVNFLIVGQSLGGEVAIKLSSTLAPQLRASDSLSLVSIDAISGKSCNPAYFLGSFLVPHKGCQSFPAFAEEELLKISSSPAQWLNFYQRDFPFLRSDATPFANENIFLDFSDAKGISPFGSHGRTEKDPRIWKRISELVLEL